ncbi:MAG: helix-turn-helix domain-containing protein [Phycisphaerales bacterium]
MRAAVGQRTHRHIAELTGTNHETARRYLSGQAPSVEFLSALCRALGLSAEWLLSGRGPMKAAEVRHHTLNESGAADLLAALSRSVERLLDRVDRLEMFVQTLETRLRARPTGEANHERPEITTRLSARAISIAHAIPERPPADAG